MTHIELFGNHIFFYILLWKISHNYLITVNNIQQNKRATQNVKIAGKCVDGVPYTVRLRDPAVF